VLAGEKASGVFTIGDHGSTFGANPLAAAAGLVVLSTVNTPEFLEEVRRKGEALFAAVENLPSVIETRARGMMIGLDIEQNAWQILEAAVARADLKKDHCGLLMLTAGGNTLRLLPPYTLTDCEIEQGAHIIKELLSAA
jgi:acetylornithine/N-succinyldiaminopimelate aminotransferase